MGVPERDPLAQLSLPPGFRFYPTDEELLVDYLRRKIAGYDFSLQIIGEVDLYKFDPWVLPSKAMFGEKEWYFFSPRDRKYPNGSRPNRVAGSGYWKATGTDKIIATEGRKVGIKKALVFYVGKAPKGTKTNWIMHEYRLTDVLQRNCGSKLDDWVLCRIYKKNSNSNSQEKQTPAASVSLSSKAYSNGSSSSSSSHMGDVLESLSNIQDQFFALPHVNSLKAVQQDEKLDLHSLDAENFIDWTNQTGFNTVSELVQTAHDIVNYNPNLNNEFYIPSIPQMREMEEEVQSVMRNQRGVENGTGFGQHNSNMITQGFPNPFDPFGFRYPPQPAGFGFGQ